MKGYFSPYDNQANKKSYTNNREGNVTINFPGSKKKMVDKSTGEYVDFEEIKS